MKPYRPNHKKRTKTPATRKYWSINGGGGKQFPAAHEVSLKEYWYKLSLIQAEHGPMAFLFLPLQIRFALSAKLR